MVELAVHDLGDVRVVAVVALAEPFHDALLVGGFAILAHLPLAFEPGDGEAKADNAAQHDIDEGLRRIRGGPRHGFVALLLRGQFTDMAEQPVLLRHHLGPAIGVHDRIIPGRHDLSVLGLRGIPVGRDVALRSLEDHQRFAAFGQVLAMRIGARQVAFDRAEWPFVLEDRREMAGVETGGGSRYQRGKWPRPHERVHLADIIDAKVIRPVHDG